MRLILEKLSYTYQPGTPMASDALKNIDLTVSEGEYLFIIGHTGSGKSTLVQHLNGLLKPTGGNVYLEQDGVRKNIRDRDFSMKTLRQAVGMVFQYPEHQLFEETVYKDIAFGPRNMGLDENEISRRVHTAMEQVGLEFALFAEKSPFELSGGQMRRVAIAGVLAMQPRILVMDEPAAGLDPLGREGILDMIRALHENGTGIVMISHSMDDVARYATRVCVLEKGEKVMEGTPGEVFARADRLKEMGLDIPVCSELTLRLREKGLAFPDCYLPGEVTEAIKALYAGRRGKHAP